MNTQKMPFWMTPEGRAIDLAERQRLDAEYKAKKEARDLEMVERYQAREAKKAKDARILEAFRQNPNSF